MSNPVAASLYGIGTGSTSTGGLLPYVTNRSPSSTDIIGPNGTFKVGQKWVNSTTNNTYSLTSFSALGGVITATWTAEGGTSSAVLTLSGDSGTAVPSAGNILIAGGGEVVTSASGSTVTVSLGGSGTVNSWTPVLSFNGNTLGITYTTQLGRYYQIGSVVFFSCYIQLSSKGIQVGQASITGLTVVSGSYGIASTGAIAEFYLNLDANYTLPAFHLQPNATLISLVQSGSAQNLADLTDVNFYDTTFLQFEGFYLT